MSEDKTVTEYVMQGMGAMHEVMAYSARNPHLGRAANVEHLLSLGYEQEMIDVVMDALEASIEKMMRRAVDSGHILS